MKTKRRYPVVIVGIRQQCPTFAVCFGYLIIQPCFSMAKRLDDIQRIIEPELKVFEKHFKESMRSKVPLLDRITYYIVKRKGKQVRPMFVFLSAKVSGQITEHTYTGASMVELLHTATLVHDDVVDESFVRRGFFSVNALWKNKIAVLVGDYLLSRGLLVALKNGQFRMLELLSASVQDMSEGELLQIEKARRLDIDESVYFEIIRQKTASLIAAACAVGAASSGCDEHQISLMKTFGEKIGIAFQIKDDLFDFGSESVGKPLGIDIKEKKMTLPLIYALKQTDDRTRKHIIRQIKNKSEDPKVVREVIAFVKASGGIPYASEAMYRYRDEAFDLLHQLPSSDARHALEDLVTFVTDRKN
jgi:octaprenyl-diphosphate synthase